jgi:hypothetical protein
MGRDGFPERRYDGSDFKPTFSKPRLSLQMAHLTQRLGPQMAGALQRLLDEVRGAEQAVLNTNQGYGEVFARIMSLWEKALRGVVEFLWQDGEQEAEVELHSLQALQNNGKKGRLVSYDTEAGRWMVEMKDGDLLRLKPTNLRLVKVQKVKAGVAVENDIFDLFQAHEAAVHRFEQAVNAAINVCADSKELRDRVIQMRFVLMRATGAGEDKEENARAKYWLAVDLHHMGAFEKALALHQEALQVFLEVLFHFALSMCSLCDYFERLGALFTTPGIIRDDESLRKQ